MMGCSCGGSVCRIRQTHAYPGKVTSYCKPFNCRNFIQLALARLLLGNWMYRTLVLQVHVGPFPHGVAGGHDCRMNLML